MRRRPYMGFQHVELMVEGHNTNPPLKPPFAQHYERWYYADGRGDWKNKMLMSKLAPVTDAAQTYHSGLPVAWHNSTWIGDRTIEFLRANKDKPFCAWASFPDPHHPFDCPEPWSRLHHPDEVDLPEHRTMDLERRPWWHKESLYGMPEDGERRAAQFPREAFAHAGAVRPPAARPDRQLLRHDLADRPQCRPHPGRARHLWPGREHAGRLLDRPRRLAG